MSGVDGLFEAYKAAYRAGEEPGGHDYVARAAPAERPLLESLIDAFLDAAPVPSGAPPAAFRDDPLAQRVMARVEPALRTHETWETVLPAARHAAEITRSTLVSRLAGVLGVGDREDRVAAYYHRMESGTLDPAGVSDRVLAALERVVGVPAQRLRDVGARRGPGALGSGAVFARTTHALEDRAAPPTAAEPVAPEGRDEVDELFLGG